MRRAGFEPAQPKTGGLQPLRLANAQPTHKWDESDLNRQTQGSRPCRFSSLRTVPFEWKVEGSNLSAATTQFHATDFTDRRVEHLPYRITELSKNFEISVVGLVYPASMFWGHQSRPASGPLLFRADHPGLGQFIDHDPGIS